MYRFTVYLLQPYSLLLLSLTAALVWMWFRPAVRRGGLAVASALMGLLYMLSTPLVGYLAIGSLEWRTPLSNAVPSPGDTIVVLSGSVLVDDEAGTQYRIGPDTFYRCLHAVKLYRSSGGCRVVVSGGKVDWTKPGPTLAGTMREFLLEQGISDADIVMEEKSSTTYENALHIKPLLKAPGDQKTLLVTDRMHMHRAELCFRAQGIAVIPSPCNPRAGAFDPSLEMLFPSPRGMEAVHEAVHEWLGLGWYQLCGRI